MNWKARGNCNGEPPQLFYRVGSRNEERAKQICIGCPVRERCLMYAIDHDEYGVWGGLTKHERHTLRIASIVQELPLTELLHKNMRVQGHPANVSPSSQPYTLDPKTHTLDVSGKVVVLQVSLFPEAYTESLKNQSLAQRH